MSGLSCAAAIALVVGCGASNTAFTPPDRSLPEVKAEEARLAPIVAESDEVVSKPTSCKVRLLRQEGDTSFAVAHCSGADGEQGIAPVRVSGKVVEGPPGLKTYRDDLERLFPKDIADALWERSEELAP